MTLIELGHRQVFKLLARFQEKGPEALTSKRRGGVSNPAHGAAYRSTVLQLVRDRYADLG